MNQILPLSFNWLSHHRRRFTMITFLLMTAITGLWLTHAHNQPAYAAPQAGSVSGNVFRDYNANGVDDGPNEPGIGGIVVTVTDNTGATATTTTADDGSYTTAVLPGTSARVEFTLPIDGSLDFLQPGAAGNTTVQFVDISGGNATNVDVGFNNPAQYCQANPEMAVPSYFGGTTSALDGIARFNYGNSGTSPAPTAISSWTTVGTTYGLAYNPAQDTVYAAAYVKRHSALAGSAGAIYRVQGATTAGPYTTSLFATIPNVGTVPDNATRGLPVNPIDPSFDPAVFSLVGQAGLGDMDISDDGSTLYVVNLNDKNVYPVSTASGTVGTPIAIPAASCTNGEWRPFAAKFRDGDLYVGGICSAENGGTRANLTAQVFRYDVATTTWSSGLFSPAIQLDFARGRGFNAGSVPDDGFWNPWINDGPTLFSRATANVGDGGILYPQPMLSDIEFDSQGYMLLGFRDRIGDQVGYLNYAVDSAAYPAGSGAASIWYSSPAGDILIAAPNGATFALENNGVVGTRTTGATSPQGPGGREFFYGDIYTNTVNFPVHQETSFGALAVRPGSAEVAMTAYDATDVDEGSIYWMDVANGGGDKLRGYRIYFGNQDPFLPAPENGRFGKANGLGDLELLCAPAPIEIGNRVWNDSNGNGIQDPGEAPLAGVTVNLYLTNGTLAGTAVTNGNGQYIFNATTVTGGVLPGTAYVIRIDDLTPITGAGLTHLSPANAGPDLRDTDATNANVLGRPNGNRPEIQITTLAAGFNNHTYDFGFNAVPTAVTVKKVMIIPSAYPAAAFLMIVPLALVSTGVFLWRKRYRH